MKISQILREYSRDITAQKLGGALLTKFLKEPPQWQARVVGNTNGSDEAALDILLAAMEQGDPTTNKQYVPWLIKSYINTPHMKFEDAVSKPYEYLQKYFKLVQRKKIAPPNNDINRIQNFTALAHIVDQYPDVVDQPKGADRGQAKEFYNDQQIRIIVPEDQQAACYYGQGTKWCTAARENNMFDRYNKDGEMYIIIPKQPAYAGEKYQLHFPSKQFMNEKDHRVNLRDLRDRFPQLADVFAQQAEEYGIIALQKSMDNIDITQILPVFRGTLNNLIASNSGSVVREISSELRAVNRNLRDFSEEITDMAEMFIEEDSPIVVNNLTRLLNDEGVDVLNDEDQLFDVLSEIVVEVRQNSELWLYITEMLEELDDTEGEFDCAMAIDGEITSLIIKLAPKALQDTIKTVQQ